MKKLLRRAAVLERRGCSKAQLYKEVAAGTFPAPVKIGTHMVAWVEDEVDTWIRAQIAARDAAGKKAKRNACHVKHAAGAAA